MASSRSLLNEDDYEELLEDVREKARSNCLPPLGELLGRKEEALVGTAERSDVEVGEAKGRLHRRLSFADGTR
jgi:hypothetical protein